MFWPAAVVRCQAVVVVCCIVFSGCSGGVLVISMVGPSVYILSCACACKKKACFHCTKIKFMSMGRRGRTDLRSVLTFKTAHNVIIGFVDGN